MGNLCAFFLKSASLYFNLVQSRHRVKHVAVAMIFGAEENVNCQTHMTRVSFSLLQYVYMYIHMYYVFNSQVLALQCMV